MSAHTPGPWHVSTSGVIVDVRHVVDGRERIVARISTRDTIEKSADEVADARLIAAAPDLLEALQEMVDGDAEAIDEAKALGVPFPEEMLKAYRKAISAIAKATGGHP